MCSSTRVMIPDTFPERSYSTWSPELSTAFKPVRTETSTIPRTSSSDNRVSALETTGPQGMPPVRLCRRRYLI
ncbi:hypothetical protein VTN02DRAFT_4907 [Thermoascus thermophilus]